MSQAKSIYLSAIHQNAGKTTISLGLFKLFSERQIQVGFLKPVGQQYVKVGKQAIDKDSYLMGEVFHLRKRYTLMSPVTIGRGFTEQYIFHPDNSAFKQKISQSYKKLSAVSDILIIEGTGHAGVGSVIDLSNADVAQMLNSKVIIISGGGIGRSIDEITINKALFDLRGVEVLGVIINKVRPEKFDKIKKYLRRGLERKGLRLLGVIPTDPILSAPTMNQLSRQLGYKVLCGRKNMHTHVENTIVAAMEPHNMMSYLDPGTLVITSGDRIDNILVSISSHLISRQKKLKIAGIILTGGLLPDERILDLLKKSSIPVLLTMENTYTVAGRIESLVCKIEKTDKDKISEATDLVRKNVDIGTILKNL